MPIVPTGKNSWGRTVKTSRRIRNMGLRIQNNIAAMNAHRQLSISDGMLSKSLARLSSGYRINSPMDDAAGLSIANSLRADIASFNVASRNTNEASALLQVAGGALDQISLMLTRLKELATQASSGNAESNLDKIDSEAQKLILEIDRIADSTEYSDSKLINGTFGVTANSTAGFSVAGGYSNVSGLKASQTYTFATAAGTGATVTISHAGGSETVSGVAAPDAGKTKDVYFASVGVTLTINSGWSASSDGTIVASSAGNSTFQVGAENVADNRISVALGDATQEKLGTGGSVGSAISAISLSTAASAQLALDIVNDAISDLSGVQGDIGAYQSRLSYAAANLAITVENTQAAESVIRDVDMAAEMISFTKSQILLQAGTAMLAHANMAPQQVLALFG
jgi:flagellin